MFASNNLSAADVAAVTGGRNNDGFGDGNGWWIILIALLFGWGRNGAFGGGYGSGNGGCCASATCQELQSGFNNQSVMQMLNGINSGICSLGYDNATLVNGVNTNVMQTGFGITSAIQRAIDGVNYNNTQNFCNLGNTMQSVGRDIIENQNANYRALHDELVQYRIEDKNDTIAELRSQVQALNLAASQSNQNTYLIDRLQPCPTPAYVVPNPNGYYGCQQNGYQSCGC